MNKMTVKDVKDWQGKRVLVRCDFNVPMKDGAITDENRIIGALPTIKYLMERGAKITLCSHMGKPHSIFSDEVKLNKKDKKKVDAGETTAEAIIEKAKKDEPKKLTLAPVAKRLNELLGNKVTFAADVVGPDAQKKVIFNVDGKEYVIGVLVQSNFGATRDLVLDGRPVGEQVIRLIEKRKSESRKKAGDGEKPALSLQDQGSIMTILATDLPVSHRQLERIIRRAGVGLARTGAYTGQGSGEVMIGFTTANRIPHEKSRKLLRQTILHEDLIDQAFQAAAEATHEAILNSMVCAGQTAGIHGEIYYSLADLLPELLR